MLDSCNIDISIFVLGDIPYGIRRKPSLSGIEIYVSRLWIIAGNAAVVGDDPDTSVPVIKQDHDILYPVVKFRHFEFIAVKHIKT